MTDLSFRRWAALALSLVLLSESAVAEPTVWAARRAAAPLRLAVPRAARPPRAGSSFAPAPKSVRAPVIRLVLDIHGDPRAQTWISETLRQWQSGGRLRAVGVEGAAGPLDVDAGKRGAAGAADLLLGTGRLSGAVHAALTAPAPMTLRGIDSPALYDADVAARDAALADRAAFEAAIAAERRAWRTAAAGAPPALLMFWARLDSLSEADRCDAIAGAAEQALGGAPDALSRFADVRRWERTRDRAAEERESRALSRRLVEQNVFRAPADLATALRAADLTPAEAPALWARASAAAAARSLSLDDVASEADDTADRIAAALAPRAGALIAERRRLHRWDEMSRLALRCSAWRRLEWTERREGGVRPAASLSFERFYRLAEARNDIMAENVADLFSAARGDIAVVVGGFHSDGLAARLADRGLPVERWTPPAADADAPANEWRAPTALESWLAGPQALAPRPWTPEIARVLSLAAPLARAAGPLSIRLLAAPRGAALAIGALTLCLLVGHLDAGWALVLRNGGRIVGLWGGGLPAWPVFGAGALDAIVSRGVPAAAALAVTVAALFALWRSPAAIRRAWSVLVPRLRRAGVSDRALSALAGWEDVVWIAGPLALARAASAAFSVPELATTVAAGLLSAAVYARAHRTGSLRWRRGRLTPGAPSRFDDARQAAFGLGLFLLTVAVERSSFGPAGAALAAAGWHAFSNAILAPHTGGPLHMAFDEDEAADETEGASEPQTAVDVVLAILDDLDYVEPEQLENGGDYRLDDADRLAYAAADAAARRGDRLDADQVIALFKALHAADVPAGERERIRATIITANWRLIPGLLKKWGMERTDDRLGWGQIALVRSVDRFDWRRGTKFSTYFAWLLRRAISAGDLVDTDNNEIARAYAAVQARMTADLGHEPTLEEVAAELCPEGMDLDVFTKKVRAAVRAARRVSLSGKKPGDEKDDMDPTDRRSTVSAADEVRDVLPRLSRRSQVVFKMMAGLGTRNGKHYRQTDLALLWRVTRERARQYRATAIKEAANRSERPAPVIADDADVFVAETFRLSTSHPAFEALAAMGREHLRSATSDGHFFFRVHAGATEMTLELPELAQVPEVFLLDEEALRARVNELVGGRRYVREGVRGRVAVPLHVLQAHPELLLLPSADLVYSPDVRLTEANPDRDTDAPPVYLLEDDGLTDAILDAARDAGARLRHPGGDPWITYARALHVPVEQAKANFLWLSPLQAESLRVTVGLDGEPKEREAKWAAVQEAERYGGRPEPEQLDINRAVVDARARLRGLMRPAATPLTDPNVTLAPRLAALVASLSPEGATSPPFYSQIPDFTNQSRAMKYIARVARIAPGGLTNAAFGALPPFQRFVVRYAFPFLFSWPAAPDDIARWWTRLSGEPVAAAAVEEALRTAIAAFRRAVSPSQRFEGPIGRPTGQRIHEPGGEKRDPLPEWVLAAGQAPREPFRRRGRPPRKDSGGAGSDAEGETPARRRGRAPAENGGDAAPRRGPGRPRGSPVNGAETSDAPAAPKKPRRFLARGRRPADGGLGALTPVKVSLAERIGVPSTWDATALAAVMSREERRIFDLAFAANPPLDVAAIHADLEERGFVHGSPVYVTLAIQDLKHRLTTLARLTDGGAGRPNIDAIALRARLLASFLPRSTQAPVLKAFDEVVGGETWVNEASAARADAAVDAAAQLFLSNRTVPASRLLEAFPALRFEDLVAPAVPADLRDIVRQDGALNATQVETLFAAIARPLPDPLRERAALAWDRWPAFVRASWPDPRVPDALWTPSQEALLSTLLDQIATPLPPVTGNTRGERLAALVAGLGLDESAAAKIFRVKPGRLRLMEDGDVELEGRLVSRLAADLAAERGVSPLRAADALFGNDARSFVQSYEARSLSDFLAALPDRTGLGLEALADLAAGRKATWYQWVNEGRLPYGGAVRLSDLLIRAYGFPAAATRRRLGVLTEEEVLARLEPLSLAKAVGELRESRGMLKRELAADLGYDEKTTGHWEIENDDQPRPADVEAIARVFAERHGFNAGRLAAILEAKRLPDRPVSGLLGPRSVPVEAESRSSILGAGVHRAIVVGLPRPLLSGDLRRLGDRVLGYAAARQWPGKEDAGLAAAFEDDLNSGDAAFSAGQVLRAFPMVSYQELRQSLSEDARERLDRREPLLWNDVRTAFDRLNSPTGAGYRSLVDRLRVVFRGNAMEAIADLSAPGPDIVQWMRRAARAVATPFPLVRHGGESGGARWRRVREEIAHVDRSTFARDSGILIERLRLLESGADATPTEQRRAADYLWRRFGIHPDDTAAYLGLETPDALIARLLSLPLNARLRALREHLGESLDHVGAAIGESEAMMSRIERGDSPITLLRRRRLLAFFAAETPLSMSALRRLLQIPTRDEELSALQGLSLPDTLLALRRVTEVERSDITAALDLGVNTYGLWETGRRRPDAAYLERLAIYYAREHGFDAAALAGDLIAKREEMVESSARPKSTALTWLTAAGWAALAGAIGPSSGLLSAAVFVLAAGAAVQAGAWVAARLGIGESELIPELRDLPSARRGAWAENVRGALVSVDAALVGRFPAWLQRALVARETSLLQRWPGGDGFSHVFVDPILVLAFAARTLADRAAPTALSAANREPPLRALDALRRGLFRRLASAA